MSAHDTPAHDTRLQAIPRAGHHEVGAKMAEGKKLPVADTIPLTGMTLGAENVALWGPIDFDSRQVVLANDRVKVNIMLDGRAVEHTFTFRVSRMPLGDDEGERIIKVKAERKAKADEKLATEQATREREIRRAVDLTKDVAFEAMARATQDAQRVAEAVKTLQGLGVKVG